MDDCFLNLIYIMKKNILLLSFLCNFSLLLSAQTNVEKGLQSINRSSAEATIVSTIVYLVAIECRINT